MPLQTLNRAIHLYRANPAVSHGLFLAGAGALGMASYSAVEHLRVDSSHLLQETTGQESQRKNQEMALQRILDDIKRKKFEARMEKHIQSHITSARAFSREQQGRQQLQHS